MIELRCERGADIVGRLRMGEAVAEAVRHLDEHWDGSGYPHGVRGEAIPLLSRICSVAQNLDVFASADGPKRALQVIRARRTTWFDPEVVWAAESLANEGRLWTSCLPSTPVEETRAVVLDLDPGHAAPVSAEYLDRLCAAFADVVDAKSPFTFRHSVGVTEVASSIASELGLSSVQCDVIRRSALLHDLGKLSVPNSILDKQGQLSASDWLVIGRHPELSGSILRRVPALKGLAALAEEHHERLDGTGYPRRLVARDLSMESRVIALADCYAAMAERRPYRGPMDPRQIFDILARQAGVSIDDRCFQALCSSAARWAAALPLPSGSPLQACDGPLCHLPLMGGLQLDATDQPTSLT